MIRTLTVASAELISKPPSCSSMDNTEKKIASEMPVPHSLGKYFQHHEIQKHCTSTKFRILSEHCQLYKVPKNV